jgi:signal transduction histidine kinase
MRTLLMELRPSALAEADLGDLLRQLGEAAAGREGIPVSVRVDQPPLPELDSQLPTDIHIALYRIAQEALNNALKYAQAGHISIELERTARQNGHCGETVCLNIEDNGRGFDPERVPSNHLGLGIMRERAEAVGADFDVCSRLGAGTRISVRLDLESPNDASAGGSNGPDALNTSDHCR